MNVYGLLAVNNHTFNLKPGSPYQYPRQLRNVLVTLLKIHNATLNVLGYMEKYAPVSGLVRITSGVLICATTLAVGERDADSGLIIQHYYDEALMTGMTQIIRGLLEAFVPNGRMINAGLDVVATFYNLGDLLQHAGGVRGRRHSDPNYPLPLFPLYVI